MPHLILAGKMDLGAAAGVLDSTVHRWGRAVLKSENRWVRSDGAALLVEGVVVEFSRPLHPVALVAPHHGDTIIRLWSPVSVERTDAVQRWLAIIAATLHSAGFGRFKGSNIAERLWQDLLNQYASSSS